MPYEKHASAVSAEDIIKRPKTGSWVKVLGVMEVPQNIVVAYAGPTGINYSGMLLLEHADGKGEVIKVAHDDEEPYA